MTKAWKKKNPIYDIFRFSLLHHIPACNSSFIESKNKEEKHVKCFKVCIKFDMHWNLFKKINFSFLFFLLSVRLWKIGWMNRKYLWKRKGKILLNYKFKFIYWIELNSNIPSIIEFNDLIWGMLVFWKWFIRLQLGMCLHLMS